MNKEKLKYERQRKKVLKQALIDINTYGFNKNMLVKAAENCNLPEGNLGRLFPEGIYELKEYFFNETDIEMLKKINQLKNKNLRIRDKIYNGVIIRLEIFQKNKDAIKHIFVSESSNPIRSIKNLWNTADLIWKSADFQIKSAVFHKFLIDLIGLDDSLTKICLIASLFF